MFPLLIVSVLQLVSLVVAISAQSQGSVPRMGVSDSAREQHERRIDSFRLEAERDLQLKREKESYQQNIERAKENARLSTEILDALTRNKSIGQEEIKKLGRMEKLSRQIRSNAGGSGDKFELENPPREIEETVKRLSCLADELNKRLDKTTRHVVSASLIQQTNEMIELIRYARAVAQ